MRWIITIFGLGIIIIIFSIVATTFDISRVGNAKTIQLSGSFQSQHERVTFYPETLEMTYRGFLVKVRYEIDEELVKQGFEYQSLPRFSLAKESTQHKDLIFSTDVKQKGDTFVAFFHNTDIGHQSYIDYYRLFLEDAGWLVKDVQKTYDAKLYTGNQISFEGIGNYEYTMDLYEDQEAEVHKLYIKSKTASEIQNPFHVDGEVLALKDGETYTTGYGTASESKRGGGAVVFSNGRYEAENFDDAEEYRLKVRTLRLDLEADQFDPPYVDLLMKGK